jgi:uncharacterized damage-inducible protein DinB
MNPDVAVELAKFLLGQIEQETTTTRKVVAAVKSEESSYAPNPKCMSAIALASHLLTSEVWFYSGIASGKFDMGEGSTNFESIEEALAFYDRELPKALAGVKAMTGEQLAKEVGLFGMTFRNVDLLSVAMRHAIHHRGQLSTYLRPMGCKVPSIYGPSGDDALVPNGEQEPVPA